MPGTTALHADGYDAVMRISRDRSPIYLDVIARCLDLGEISRFAPGGGFSGRNVGINLQNLARWDVLEKLPDELQKNSRSTVYYRFVDEAGARRALFELGRIS
jgi:hypothetical protein